MVDLMRKHGPRLGVLLVALVLVLLSIAWLADRIGTDKREERLVSVPEGESEVELGAGSYVAFWRTTGHPDVVPELEHFRLSVARSPARRAQASVPISEYLDLVLSADRSSGPSTLFSVARFKIPDTGTYSVSLAVVGPVSEGYLVFEPTG